MASIETDRLLLRPFRESDLDAYAAIMADPRVMRFMDGPQDRTAAWRGMAGCLGHWALRGYGLWAAEERASGELIGRIGLINPEGWPGLEVGWLLARSRWGRGYATEGARAALGHAFGVLGADRVISLIKPRNAASIRVAERLGERFERKIEFFGGETLVYGIDRPDRPSPTAI
jgi:RimJ/RimL family protein N-acetyltransferase